MFAWACPCVQVARNMESGVPGTFKPKVLIPIGFATITWRILVPVLTITGILQSTLLPAFGIPMNPPRTGFPIPYLFGTFVVTVLLQKFRRRLAKEHGIQSNPPCPTILYQFCCCHFIPIMQETRLARAVAAPAKAGGNNALVGAPVGVVPGTAEAGGAAVAGKPKTAWGEP